MKILVFGLPGSGKTWLAERLQRSLNCSWFNADEIRKMANDWEFSEDARLRQATRMKNIADFEKQRGATVICDFVCPTQKTREIFDADITIFMDTIESGRFEDTNRVFETPEYLNSGVDFRVVRFLTDSEIESIATDIKGV